mgnify:FL=1
MPSATPRATAQTADPPNISFTQKTRLLWSRVFCHCLPIKSLTTTIVLAAHSISTSGLPATEIRAYTSIGQLWWNRSLPRYSFERPYNKVEQILVAPEKRAPNTNNRYTIDFKDNIFKVDILFYHTISSNKISSLEIAHMKDYDIAGASEQILQIIKSALSITVLTFIGIIISGKFLHKAYPIYFSDDDEIKLNIKIIKVSAKNGEVLFGLSSFIISLVLCIIIVGENAQTYINSRTGLSLDQWTSLCAVASSACIIFSILMMSYKLISGNSEIIEDKERIEMLRELEQKD